MKTFSSTVPSRPGYANAMIARDFLDLTFQLENGERLPILTRFDGPITVKVVGRQPDSLQIDLRKLLRRLRREARINIRQTSGDGPASIVVETVSRDQITSVAPSAACFVRPNVSSWREYRARRNDPRTFWTQLTERRQMAVFIPFDVSPQEIRDCLHEEISQALGPVNDIYRLSQSIFNDDNFHTVLTGYDMLILRAYYDPALESGLTQSDVAARLPALLARLNPSGGRDGIARPRTEFAAWQAAIDRATRPGANRSRRAAAARRAIELSLAYGPADPRLAFSYYVLGRLTLGTDPNGALDAFLAANRIYRSRTDTDMQEAHVAMQIAAFQLAAGQPQAAVSTINRNISVATKGEHAALLSLMLFVKAEALSLLDRTTEAESVQRDALAWARYGFGSEADIRARVREIKAISPRTAARGAS